MLFVLSLKNEWRNSLKRQFFKPLFMKQGNLVHLLVSANFLNITNYFKHVNSLQNVITIEEYVKTAFFLIETIPSRQNLPD